MAMTQCLSTALKNSSFKLRCLPICTTLVHIKDQGILLDPNERQLSELAISAFKARFVFNIDTEEILVSSLEQTQTCEGLSFDQMESMVSLALSAAKKLHKMVRE